ncbi:MAG: DUF4287 domain-containing protein [Caulobacterales bacterium]|nr:DUF4287 domain-containing protein [Caulobacterales bacterium]
MDNPKVRKHDFAVLYDNIALKTGKRPEDFQALAKENGLLKNGTKPAQIIAWLKNEFALGHGHAMAIYYTIKPLIGK